MKKILCAAAALLLIMSLLAGCGSKTVSTKVDAKYADDFAKNYASDVKTDENGNVSYEFTDEKYREFLKDYHEEVENTAKSPLIEHEGSIDTTYGQYAFFNEDMTEVVVGVMPESYDEAYCRAEAEEVGAAALKFQMNTANPKGSLTVRYENCNTAEEFFTITVTAE